MLVKSLTATPLHGHCSLQDRRDGPTTGIRYAITGRIRQASVYRMYQVLRSGNVPASQIIVMQADDIAIDGLNPFPGRVYNEVGGPNVYANIQTDYSGSAVTSANFFAVLKVS
eukprot:4873828-Pyramimonas_sp.AAC.4